jgi:hypothetical protein
VGNPQQRQSLADGEHGASIHIPALSSPALAVALQLLGRGLRTQTMLMMRRARHLLATAPQYSFAMSAGQGGAMLPNHVA